MMFHVVAIGRLRDAGVRAACDEYIRRAGRTVRIAVREVPEAGRRAANPAETLRLEGRGLTSALPSNAVPIAVTRKGKAFASREFARRVARWRDGARDVAFLIGGAHGIDPDVIAGCADRISLSSLTLPHDLARLVLLEQLYRATTLLDGHPYHKGD